MKSVLFIFAGDRKSKFRGVPGVDFPDTALYGLNHLVQYGFATAALEPADVFASERLRRWVPYRLKHFILFFKTLRHDIVFGPSLLYLMLAKKVWKTRTKFVLLNIELTRMLNANKNNRVKLRFIVWLLKELDGIVCLTQFQKKYLEETFPFLRGKCFFVPLGVDVKYYLPTYENRSAYLLSAGRDMGRDYATVIDTARRMPEREFHIVCSQRNLKGIHDVPPNVRIFIDLPFAELHKKYQEAELLLLLTHNDSFQGGADCSGQTVLLDAMANGLPVVASRKKYVEEYVTDGKEAVLVDCYDPAKARIAIESLRAVDLRKEMALRARTRVEREFSTEKMAERLATVFTRLSEHNYG
ncbi:MAG: glycosyltransferase [Patescibacteria group bacterium]|nr:glycosyltransferase [Patescibacteria group bacterium]